jgi:hypothetical protein
MSIDLEKLLWHRAETKKNLQKKSGSMRKYARDNKLHTPVLFNIINGKFLLKEKEFLPSSSRKKVVETLFMDNLWSGPIPQGMIIDPLHDFHKGANVGGFDKNRNLVISNRLFLHLNQQSIDTYDKLIFIALIDATASTKGFSTVSNKDFGKFLSKSVIEIEQMLEELHISSWIKIEMRNEIRIIRVTEITPPIGENNEK